MAHSNEIKENNVSEWSDTLKIGDKIDVHDTTDDNWSICKILKIDKDKKRFRIHFEGWNKKYDQWIDMKINKKNKKQSNDNIITAQQKHDENVNKLSNNTTLKEYAPLNTYTTKCEYLAKPKKMKTTNNSSIVYFYSDIENKKYLIITNGYNNDNKCVNKYDITNELACNWIQFIQYPHGFMPINNGNILGVSENDKHILYIFGGKTGVFGKLNLNNGQWEILCKNMGGDMDNFDKYGIKNIWSPMMFWLNNNDLHIFGNAIQPKVCKSYNKGYTERITISYHIKYDKILNKCFEISNSKQNGYEHLNNSKIIYAKHLKTFLNFSGKKDIFYCNDMNEFKWYKSHKNCPGNSLQYVVENVCGYLVFIIYLYSRHNKEIWILDINENKWYKSHKNCPSIDMRAKPHIINTKDGWLHFIGGHKYHFKLMIDDIIVNELHNKYHKIKDLLIVGYIKKMEKKYKLFTRFNDDLIKLLMLYYPKFGI